MSASVKALFVITLAGAALACGRGPAGPRGAVSKAPAARAPAEPADVLGERPQLPPPPPFVPPVPIVYTRANGMKVWLLERHTLPVVAMQIVVPAGAAKDPEGKGGLALATANMLDEGAGKRGALEISRDLDRLGATLHTGALADYAFVSLTTLTKNLDPAGAIFGEVITKPSMSPIEWKRVHELWTNDLRSRASDPEAVAAVVSLRQVFENSPYGHPTSGTQKSAAKVTLEDVKSFYASQWRPDQATLVAAGDVTRGDLEPLLDRIFAGWKASSVEGKPLPAKSMPKSNRRVVIVDRPDAPQSVLAVVRPGVAAAEPDAAPLTRINAALGGSFTSRLNQDLREEHGWSYGAHSRLSFSKERGMFAAQAAVHTEHTGEALRAMLAHIEAIARDGLTDEEFEKTRLLARGDLVEAFAQVEAAARRLARNAAIGLSPDHEKNASVALNGASKTQLKALAARYFDPQNAVIVIVGPRRKIEPQLKAIGITTLISSGPEGDAQ